MVQRFRISTKLLLTILPLAFLAIGTSVYLNNMYQEREMLEQAKSSAQRYGEFIRTSLVNMMVTREQIDDEYLRQLNNLKDVQDLHIQFSIENLHLRENFHSPERFERLRRREALDAPTTPEELKVFRTGEPMWQLEGNMFTALVPFRAEARCQQCHAVPIGHVLGAANMKFSLERIASAIRNNWIRSFFVFLVFTSLAAVAGIILYRKLVAKRMNELVANTTIIGSGNLDHPVGTTSSQDELGELSRAIENMRVQLKKAQERLVHTERLSTIGQMASSVIHDFRAPMSTINLAVQSLQERKGLSPEKTEHWFLLIRDAINRMVSMAQEILDYSRGESHLEKSEFPIGEFVNLLARSVKTNLDQAKVQFNIDQQCEGAAVFDADRLHRALVNIINNAQDAMPGGGTLHLTSRREDHSICFTLTDSGGGIPDEIREKIFDAFVTAGKKKGTGLGLAITKRIIDQHGGTIEVESEKGKGTTFVVRIPIGNAATKGA